MAVSPLNVPTLLVGAEKPNDFNVCGGLGRIRTPDPLIRSQVLYPAELPIRVWDHLDLRAL